MRPGCAALRAAAGSTTSISPKRSASSCATSAASVVSGDLFGAAGGRRQGNSRAGTRRQVHGRADARRRSRRACRRRSPPSCSTRATAAKAPARSRGRKPQRCSTCGGSGEVRRAQRSFFGQFVSVAPCPDVLRRRHGHRRAVQEVPGRRARARRPHDPGADSGRRRDRAVHDAARRRQRRAARRPAWRRARRLRRRGRSALRARRRGPLLRGARHRIRSSC